MRRSPKHSGFTMIELLTVITIIVLMLAMAVPLVRVIQGNRSLDAGYNSVAAAIGHARQMALYYRQPAGLIFYRDPTTGNQDIAYVMKANFLASNTQAFPNYLLTWPMSQTPAATPLSTLSDSYVDIVPGEPMVTLPQGLAVQMVIGNGAQFSVTIGGNISTVLERYMRMGVVLFDEDGQLVSTPYAISYYSTINQNIWGGATTYQPGTGGTAPANLVSVTATAPLKYSVQIYYNTANPIAGLNPTAAPTQLFTHSAICLYDEESYLNQTNQYDPAYQDQFSDANNNTITFNTLTANGGAGQYFAAAPSPGVGTAAVTGTYPPEVNVNGTVADFDFDKFAEQSWLDQNGEVLVIKPNDGSLLRNK